MGKNMIVFIGCVLILGCSHHATYQDAEIENTFITVPGSKVKLGSSRSQKIYAMTLSSSTTLKSNIKTEMLREVEVPQFQIQKYLVTYRQYKEYLDRAGVIPMSIDEKTHLTSGSKHGYSAVLPYLFQDKQYNTQLEKFPVVMVSASEAQNYCQWLGAQNGKKGRLPSEDEWEKAARGEESYYFPWGNHWSAVNLNSHSIGPGRSTHVNRYIQGVSPYGLFDMSGNVFQWTETAPKDSSKNFYVKGCAWHSSPAQCRGASHVSKPQTVRDLDIGFRCVLEH